VHDPEQRRLADSPAPGRGRLYAITVRDRVGNTLLDAFGPMQVCPGAGQTVLHGTLEDQAALYGVLARIQALGLELEEVRLLPAPPPG
jgi:hypothetical protein